MPQQIAEQIEGYIQQDPGGRGIANWACRAELLPAAQSLYESRRILITTGFYILSAGAIETDGPPGAIILANALTQLGKPVSILVDDHAAHIMQSGLDYIGCDVELIEIAPGEPIAADRIIHKDTTHFVAIERPGRSRDGSYYNFAGKDISQFVAPIDDIFAEARNQGIVTIGIGDGGNELGMDFVSAKVDSHLKFDKPISCCTGADYCICAGVSNWGGYGMAALLSLLSGKDLLPQENELVELLNRIVSAGAVDGISAKPHATVDGLEAHWESSIYANVRQITETR